LFFGKFCAHFAKCVVSCDVYIGEGTHIGIGAVNNSRFESWQMGYNWRGAVVINDIPDFAVVVGNPEKIKKYNIM